jgi:hypothetical protein
MAGLQRWCTTELQPGPLDGHGVLGQLMHSARGSRAHLSGYGLHAHTDAGAGMLATAAWLQHPWQCF